MTAPEPMIPPEIPRFDSIQDLRQWNADRIRRQMRKPADEAIEKMQRDLRDGLLSRIAGALRGEGLPGFEVVRDAVRDGLLPGIADAVRDAANLPGQYVPVRDAIRDLIFPVTERLDGVEESQLSAEEQLAALDGVRGYGGVYMSRNVNASGLGGNERWLPFDAPVGVMKGVHVGVSADDARQVGLVLESPGVWQINFRAHARATAATPGLGVPDNSQAYPGVYRIGEDGVWRMWRESILVVNNGSRESTITGSMLVSIPDDGFSYAVGAYAWSSRWRWWSGGMKYSDLSVVKHDNRPGVAGEMTVPDE